MRNTIGLFRILTSSLLLLCVLVSVSVLGQPDEYEVIPLCDLDLNRTATSLTEPQLSPLFPAHKGFLWNIGDNETLKFRPQGITDVFLDCKRYIAVTWYGRADQDYENRGARVSFVNITNMDSIEYRHVLLVDEEYNTLEGIHAGGLHYLNGHLFVPDTRSTSNKRIYAFDLADIKRVPDEDLEIFYNYRYILKITETIHLPIQPSCVSYDWDSEEFMIATFYNLCDVGCVFNAATTFSWFEKDSVTSSSPYHINFFDRTQGIASIDDFTEPTQKMIWTSQSYGKFNPSYLYATTYVRDPNDMQGQLVDTDQLVYNSITLPPGLEDLHIQQSKDTLWTLTEFGPNEGGTNHRYVFAFALNDILPPGIPDNVWELNKSHPFVTIYPNPFSETIVVNGKWTGPVDLRIYSHGQVIYEKKLLADELLNLNHLAPGLYSIIITAHGQVYSSLIMKQ